MLPYSLMYTLYRFNQCHKSESKHPLLQSCHFKMCPSLYMTACAIYMCADTDTDMPWCM